MIQEDYVGFEVAKLLKEKGFDELCRCVYSPEGVFHKSNRTNIYDYYDNALLDEVGNADYFLDPTQAQVMKWLREVHNLHINIFVTWRDKIPHYQWSVDNLITQDTICDTPCLEKYEQAAEASIEYCLENLI